MNEETTETDCWSLKDHCPDGSQEVWFYRKNLAPSVGYPSSTYGHVAHLTFRYEAGNESGSPSHADEGVLSDIERIDIAKMAQDGLSVLVGVATKPGLKELLLYTRDPEMFRCAALPIQKANPDLLVECEVSSDPEWKHYTEFP